MKACVPVCSTMISASSIVSARITAAVVNGVLAQTAVVADGALAHVRVWNKGMMLEHIFDK